MRTLTTQQPLSNVGLWAEEDAIDLAALFEEHQDRSSLSKVDAWAEATVSALVCSPGTDLFGNLGADNLEDEQHGYSGTYIYLNDISGHNIQATFPSNGSSTYISTQDDVTTIASPYETVFSETASQFGVPQFVSEHHSEVSGHSQIDESYYQVDDENLLSWDRSVPVVEPTNQENYPEYIGPFSTQTLASTPSTYAHSTGFSPDTKQFPTGGWHSQRRRPSSSSYRKPKVKTIATSPRSSPTMTFQYDDPDADAKSAVMSALWTGDHLTRHMGGHSEGGTSFESTRFPDSESYEREECDSNRPNFELNNFSVRPSNTLELETSSCGTLGLCNNVSSLSPYGVDSPTGQRSPLSVASDSQSFDLSSSQHHVRKAPSVRSTRGRTEGRVSKVPYTCSCGTVIRSGRNRDVDRHRSRCKVSPNSKELKCTICQHPFQFGRPDRLRNHMERVHPEHISQ